MAKLYAQKCLINVDLKHVRSQMKFSIRLTWCSVIISDHSFLGFFAWEAVSSWTNSMGSLDLRVSTRELPWHKSARISDLPYLFLWFPPFSSPLPFPERKVIKLLVFVAVNPHLIQKIKITKGMLRVTIGAFKL